jgi:hypothetical protein
MSLFRLTAEDAESVADLAELIYPEEMALSVEEISEALQTAEQEEGNLSLGLSQGHRLRAYLLAWLEESRVEGLKESVVLVDDIGLSEESLFPEMLKGLAQVLEESELGHLAIEGAMPGRMRQLFGEQRKLLERLGYREVNCQTYTEDEWGLELTWVRFERIEEELPEQLETEGEFLA